MILMKVTDSEGVVRFQWVDGEAFTELPVDPPPERLGGLAVTWTEG